MIISAPSTPPQDQPASTPDETTPTLRPWFTPCMQRLNGAARDTQGGMSLWHMEDSVYHPS
jgi:hypothetical protein